MYFGFRITVSTFFLMTGSCLVLQKLFLLFFGTGDKNGRKVIWLDKPKLILPPDINLNFLTVPLTLYSFLKFLCVGILF